MAEGPGVTVTSPISGAGVTPSDANRETDTGDSAFVFATTTPSGELGVPPGPQARFGSGDAMNSHP
jgi:hypothetical protein